MEKEDTILNNSQDQEECKINDSNKNFDKDLCLFLPKNIVEEISEKRQITPKIQINHNLHLIPSNLLRSTRTNIKTLIKRIIILILAIKLNFI